MSKLLVAINSEPSSTFCNKDACKAFFKYTFMPLLKETTNTSCDDAIDKAFWIRIRLALFNPNNSTPDEAECEYAKLSHVANNSDATLSFIRQILCDVYGTVEYYS